MRNSCVILFQNLGQWFRIHLKNARQTKTNHKSSLLCACSIVQISRENINISMLKKVTLDKCY